MAGGQQLVRLEEVEVHANHVAPVVLEALLFTRVGVPEANVAMRVSSGNQ